MSFGKMVSEAKTFGDRNYLKPGNYLLELQVARTNDGLKGLFGIAEFKVIESEATEAGVAPSPKGLIVSYSEGDVRDVKKGPAKLGRFKKMLSAIAGEELDGSGVDDAVGKYNPLAFIRVRCMAYSKVLAADPAKGYAGTTLTNFTWTSVEEIGRAHV